VCCHASELEEESSTVTRLGRLKIAFEASDGGPLSPSATNMWGKFVYSILIFGLFRCCFLKGNSECECCIHRTIIWTECDWNLLLSSNNHYALDVYK
jgi:hypothetical protein